MEEKFSLKDHLFNPEKVTQLAQQIAAVSPNFQPTAFIADVVASFPVLELKQRITHIRTCLHTHLPTDYRKAVALLLEALPAPLDEWRTDDDFGDFIYAPFGDFVAHYGCTQEHLVFSLAALREITKRFSAEDAIRYFINAFPEETFSTLLDWTQDPNYHVRRLCSEGSRPKLPWSQKLTSPPEKALPILDRLYTDPTRYVIRSVANHLNDLSKIQPETVLLRLSLWSKQGGQVASEMAFLQKHALRTLVKTGQPAALVLLGYGDHHGVTLTLVQHSLAVKMGEALRFSFRLTTEETKNLVVDYVLYFQSKLGQRTNKKIYKLRTINLSEGETIHVEKMHPLRRNMTTRPLFPGTHKVEIQVNGAVLAHFIFELTP
ncbi:MAG TPA: hypothetical protein PLL64_01660 [Rhodothermales bacterium]|nr:DNA alkylation repair protein [Bacteroidota bacterium]HRK72953.1 hypothetical protein [Rhodothermales bacterium]HRR07325.1 hypothetical protein [Rhodothermales bacterium]